MLYYKECCGNWHANITAGVKYSLLCRSLLADCPLYRLIGDLPLSNHHCKYILAHKYFLVRPPAQPQTIIGYLASSQKRIPLLIEALKSCLSVWSSSSSLRHMSDQQHLRISSLIVLAITCIDTSFLLSKVVKWMLDSATLKREGITQLE